MRLHTRGMSLLDLTVVVAIIGVVTSMALPSYQSQLARARRAEAIGALTRVLMAQEQFRAEHGVYALALASLKGAGSPAEHYELTLVSAHARGYIVRATARRPSWFQEGCQELTLSVSDGQAMQGPSEHCWNR